MNKKPVIIGIIGVFLLMHPLGAQTWEKTKRLTWNSGGSIHPKVAVDTSNNIHVVWYDHTPGNTEIYYKRSTNGGITWGCKRLSWTSDNSYEPEIAVDTSNNIHVVWYDNTPGKGEIYYKRSTDGGVKWGGVQRLTWNSGHSSAPAIYVDSSNTIHVVWDDSTSGESEIYYKKSTNEGVTWGSSKRITWNSRTSYYPDIAVDSSNRAHVVWYDDYYSGGYKVEIYYKRSTNGGGTWGDSKRFSRTSDESFYPNIAVDSISRVHVVWFSDRGGYYQIYYKRSTDGGGIWDSVKRLTWSSSSSEDPAIAADSSNNIHLVWGRWTSGNDEIYYKRSTNGGGTWGSVQRLTWNSGYSDQPSIVVSSNNTIHVVWVDNTPGNKEIYYRRGGQ